MAERILSELQLIEWEARLRVWEEKLKYQKLYLTNREKLMKERDEKWIEEKTQQVKNLT